MRISRATPCRAPGKRYRSFIGNVWQATESSRKAMDGGNAHVHCYDVTRAALRVFMQMNKKLH